MFALFFELASKDKNERTANENLIFYALIDFMVNVKHDLIQSNNGIAFDKSQIIFCLPIEWAENQYTNYLHTLFLESGWIAKQGHQTSIIFLPFVECLTNYVQNVCSGTKIKLERERKYLLCYISDSRLSIKCFRMQACKELIAVSRKLAASDFFLTPTVLDSDSICLSRLDGMIYNKIKAMITAEYTRRADLGLNRYPAESGVDLLRIIKAAVVNLDIIYNTVRRLLVCCLFV